MNMKKYYFLSLGVLLAFFATALLAGCDTDGEQIDRGFMQLRVKVAFQGDADHKYTFTYLGQPTDEAFYDRTDTVGEFVALNNGAEEMRTTLHLKSGTTVLQLAQLPGKPIQFLDSIGGGTAADPQDTLYTKVRFLIETNAVAAENLRVILRMNDKKGTPFDTLEFRKGELSPYSEDLSITAQKESPYAFNLYDMANPAKPKTLWTKVKMDFDTTGKYKFQTYKVDSYKRMTFLFGEAWSEE